MYNSYNINSAISYNPYKISNRTTTGYNVPTKNSVSTTK